MTRIAATMHDAVMLNEPSPPTPSDLEGALRRGPWGAVIVCGIAVGAVIAIWFLFYWLAFLPRVAP